MGFSSISRNFLSDPNYKPRVAAQTHRVMATFSLRLNLSPDHDKEQTSPLSSLKARWPAEKACQNAQRLRHSLELENASLWSLVSGNLVCAHGIPILTNRESSELVGERIFYALQISTQTI